MKCSSTNDTASRSLLSADVNSAGDDADANSDDKNAAAVTIQHTRRRYTSSCDDINNEQCDNDMIIGDKTKKIKDLLESNDEILKKLEAVRNSKAYEQMKYDTIARMNAHDVNTFLKEQFSERQQHAIKQNSNTEYESIVQKRHQAKLNEAACIIQRFFRSVAVKKRREKLRKAWTEVDPQRRVQLISDIADRIAVSRDAPQRVDLQTIKNKLKERKEGLDKAIADYEKCERMIKQMQQDLQLLAGITSIEQLIKLDPRKLRCTKLALLLAERERERQLDRMQHDHDDTLEEFATSPPPPEGDLTSA